VFTPLFLWAGYVAGGGDARGTVISISGFIVFALAISYWILLPLSFTRPFTVHTIGHGIIFPGVFAIGMASDLKLDGMGKMALYIFPLYISLIVLIGAVILAISRFLFLSHVDVVPGRKMKCWFMTLFSSVFAVYGTLAFLYYKNLPSCEEICIRNMWEIESQLPATLSGEDLEMQGFLWCDYIKRNNKGEVLRCSLDKVGPCSYAINENLLKIPFWRKLDSEIVVLFESRPGWNQVGGSELIQSYGHYGKKGIFVFFAKGGAKYIEEEDIPKLKWIPDEDK